MGEFFRAPASTLNADKRKLDDLARQLEIFEAEMGYLREEYKGDLEAADAKRAAERAAAPAPAPLASVTDAALEPRAFARLRESVLGHERVADGASECLGEAFGASAGFVVRFSDAARLAADPETACLVPFFDAARDPSCDAFVLNVLVPRPGGDLGGDLGGGDLGGDDLAVSWHRDATVALRGPSAATPPLARRVSVLYLVAPGVGGDLLLRRPGRPPRRACEGRRGAPDYVDVDERVSPAANRLVAFDGGAEHAVEAFRGRRVSLVLEQYRADDDVRRDLVAFEVVDAAAYVRSR